MLKFSFELKQLINKLKIFMKYVIYMYTVPLIEFWRTISLGEDFLGLMVPINASPLSVTMDTEFKLRQTSWTIICLLMAHLHLLRTGLLVLHINIYKILILIENYFMYDFFHCWICGTLITNNIPISCWIPFTIIKWLKLRSQ